MTGASLPDLVLFGKPGCGLCDETRELLEVVLARRAQDGLPSPALVAKDILADPSMREAFGATIPVLEYGDRRLELAIGGGTIRRFLAEALDGRVAEATP